MSEPQKLNYYVNGQWRESKAEKWMECFNPSTGEVTALAPQCTQEEVDSAIKAASDAFPAWAATAVTKRAQVLFRMKALVDKLRDLGREEAHIHRQVFRLYHNPLNIPVDLLALPNSHTILVHDCQRAALRALQAVAAHEHLGRVGLVHDPHEHHRQQHHAHQHVQSV